MPRRLNSSVMTGLGFVWFMRFMNGESFAAIGRSVGRDKGTIAKYVRKAADTLTDAAQEKVLQEIFPLALEVYKAKLDQQLKAIKDGKDVDIKEAERIMKGMLVFDRPQVKDLVTQDDAEIQTLAGFMVKRLSTNQNQKVIEGQKVEENDED